MATFASRPVAEVKPKTVSAGPKTDRKEQYEAIRDALKAEVDAGMALVVTFDPDAGEKPLTIRNRLLKAADELGLTEGFNIRRKGNEVRAYVETPVSE